MASIVASACWTSACCTIALVGEIGERRLGGGEIGLSQVELGLVVGRIDDRDQIALAHGLEVIDRHFGDVPGHAGRERRHIARDEGVVGRFEPRRAGPAVPMSGRVPDEPGGEDEEERCAEAERASASVQPSRRSPRVSGEALSVVCNAHRVSAPILNSSAMIAPRTRSSTRRQGEQNQLASAPAGSAWPTTRRASGKACRDRALERIDGVVNGLDRRRRIDAAVEEDNHAAGGFAHADVVNVAQAPLRGGRLRRAKPRCGGRGRARPIARCASGSAGSMWVSTSTPSPISSAMASSSSEASAMRVAERHRAVDFEIEGDGLAPFDLLDGDMVHRAGLAAPRSPAPARGSSRRRA